MESLWWTKPAVYRRFHSTEAQAQTTKSLAFNQGFYNLFLAVGAVAGVVAVNAGQIEAGRALVLFACGSMAAAGSSCWRPTGASSGQP
jgi:putative membrane protein